MAPLISSLHTNTFLTSVGVGVLMVVLWSIVDWIWWRPKKLERILRQQGLPGTSYRLYYGDLNDVSRMGCEAKSKPMDEFSNSLTPRLRPFSYQLIKKYDEDKSNSGSGGAMTDGSTAADSGDPLYMASSEQPGLILENKFDRKGFACWKMQVLIALGAKNKIGFVDGTLTKPTDSDAKARAWTRCDSMVRAWLIMSIEKRIADTVLFAPTAALIWKELCKRYEHADGTRMYDLEQRLAMSKKGSDNIVDYFTKVKQIWDEIDASDTVPTSTCGLCTCDASSKFKKYVRERRMIQFLMGLDERYGEIPQI